MRGFLWVLIPVMRLDRFLESRLASSARQVRLLLLGGEVRVDGAVERDPRRQVGKFSRIEAEGALLQAREAVYLMLHKPRGCVSATRDARHDWWCQRQGRPHVSRALGEGPGEGLVRAAARWQC